MLVESSLWSGLALAQLALVLALVPFTAGQSAHLSRSAVRPAGNRAHVMCAVKQRIDPRGPVTAGLDHGAEVPDRRRTPREPMCCGAQLEVAGRVWAVNLLDLSEGGAGVQAPSDIVAVAAEGHLVIDTAVLAVRVAAVGPERLGLAFAWVTPHASAVIRSILSEPAREDALRDGGATNTTAEGASNGSRRSTQPH